MDPVILKLDVRELPAPEPLEVVIKALNSAKENEIILMIHRQNPCLLFDILKERNLEQITKIINNIYYIYIYHLTNLSAQQYIEQDKSFV